MVCLLTHWVYVCEGEIAYGSGGVRASVSPSKYICVRLHSVYGCVCVLDALVHAVVLHYVHVFTLFILFYMCVSVFYV